MLRIVVIALVVANLFLLGFQGSKPASEPVQTASPKRVSGDPRIPTIHLFSEMVENENLLTGNRRCFSIGPFHTPEDRDSVRSSLLEVSTGIGERETEALVEKGYWVFMPPYVSLLEANQELLSLKALGLEDVGIIYDGEWKNAISLGYFLRQENAQRRKKNLENRGYQPLIRVRRQSEPRYWLDYEQPPGSDLLTLDLRGRPNDFMQRPLPCPEERLPAVAVDQPSETFEAPVQAEPVAENLASQTEQVEAKDTTQAEPPKSVSSSEEEPKETDKGPGQALIEESTPSGPETALSAGVTESEPVEDNSTDQPEQAEDTSDSEQVLTTNDSDSTPEPLIETANDLPGARTQRVGTGPDPITGAATDVIEEASPGNVPASGSEDGSDGNTAKSEEPDPESPDESPAEQAKGDEPESTDDTETDGR